MLILAIKTDQPMAEVSLYEDKKQIAQKAWLAHYELAKTIHLKIKELLSAQQKELTDLEGIIVFKGPGSFTGLRIGASVANALADSYRLPMVSAAGEYWQERATSDLLAGRNQKIVLPEYGAEPNITKQKK